MEDGRRPGLPVLLFSELSSVELKAHRLLLGHAASVLLLSLLQWAGKHAQLSAFVSRSLSEPVSLTTLTRRRYCCVCNSSLQDLLGRWSVLPVLAVACCVWNKWKATQLEGKLEQAKLEEVRLYVCSAHATKKNRK